MAEKKKMGINFDFLQKFGKVLMVVIAVMPAAGLMISLGKLIGMSAGDIAMLSTIGSVVENIGWAEPAVRDRDWWIVGEGTRGWRVRCGDRVCARQQHYRTDFRGVQRDAGRSNRDDAHAVWTADAGRRLLRVGAWRAGVEHGRVRRHDRWFHGWYHLQQVL